MYIKSSFIETSRFEKKFEKFKNIPFSFFHDYRPSFEELSLNSINIFAHGEPNEYFGNHDWILNNKDQYSAILTWSDRILKKCNNALLIPYGESWIDENDDSFCDINDKKFEISFIRGKKLQSCGHLLRHQLFNRQDEILIPYIFYPETDTSSPEQLIKNKIEIHKHSMFSLIIENTNHHNYFTEKISDCIFAKTIPVYWGCSNIEKYYDIEGIIKIENDDDAIEKINNLTPELYYSKKEVIDKNWEKTFEYKDYVLRIANMLEIIFKENKLL
jgi:hypothetical protein